MEDEELKKKMTLRDYLIMLVVASLIVFSLGLGYTGLQQRYGFSVENSTMGQIQVLNVLNESYSMSEELKGNLTRAQITEGESLTGFLKAGYQVIKLTTNSFKIISTMGLSAVSVLGIPAQFYFALMSVVMLFVTFGILRYMFRFRG